MARVTKKLCSVQGCPEFQPCPVHRRTTSAEQERQRGSAAKRGYGRRWQKIRLMKLRRDPLCEDHLERGEIVEATEVDHVDGDVGNVAWENLRSLCKPCHSRKTVRENGGLGRRAPEG